ncbi:MOSC domain-containing protein [Pseudomonas monteilii]|uniref:MOSC domain-containing protein n=1 Tax=Pseudomonas monteilii TaxID=76759 RepID=UPI00383AC93A
MSLTVVNLDTLLTGRAQNFTRPGSRSAIAKSPRREALRITALGLVGDEQGDTRIHGGVDKAIHHYPREHYASWAMELGAHPLLASAGAFGENFSTAGWTEADVCLGDRIRAGTALLEVSQGRMPCWKLSDRFGIKDLALRVQQSGRTGWYYRVLEEGTIAAGSSLQLVERTCGDWSLARLAGVLFDKKAEPGLLRECLGLPLTPSWRRTLERRLDQGVVEDWSPRLQGEDSYSPPGR